MIIFPFHCISDLVLSIRSRQYSSDSDEEFSLDKSHLTDQALEHALPKEHDETYSSMNESFDELELRPVPRHIKHVPTGMIILVPIE